jgi:single-stranded-DNA-specific exonuclease
MRGSTRWEIAQSDPAAVEQLTKSLKVSTILAQLLWTRGFRDELSARNFLNSQLRDLKDPFLLPGMQKAIERTFLALEKQERIVLYGDYDVDGVASVGLMG